MNPGSKGCDTDDVALRGDRAKCGMESGPDQNRPKFSLTGAGIQFKLNLPVDLVVDHRMKAVTWVFVVAVWSCALLTTFGQECTPQTCPPGPVLAHFEYANCTGAVTYLSLAEEIETTCVVSGSTSYFSEITESLYAVYLEINNPDCDVSLSNATYTSFGYYFGTCVPVGPRRTRFSKSAPAWAFQASRRDTGTAAATMYLSSVNATFDAPQEPWTEGNINNLTTLAEANSQEACESANNCTTSAGTAPQLTFTSHSEAGNCSTAHSSVMFPNLKVGQCMYDENNQFVSFYCGNDPHSYKMKSFVGQDCSRPYTFQMDRITCESNVGGENVHCAVPPSPTDQAPSESLSTASTLSVTPLATALVIALALILPL